MVVVVVVFMNELAPCVGLCMYGVGRSSLVRDDDCRSGGPLKMMDSREEIEEDFRCFLERGWRYSLSVVKRDMHFIVR